MQEKKKRVEENSCKKKRCFIQSDLTKKSHALSCFFFYPQPPGFFLFGPFTLLSISNRVNKYYIPSCVRRSTQSADVRNHVNSKSQWLMSMCPLAVVALNYSVECVCPGHLMKPAVTLWLLVSFGQNAITELYVDGWQAVLPETRRKWHLSKLLTTLSYEDLNYAILSSFF